ncbi:transposase [Bifidobacterium adolescentis]|uniref:Mutator family transposase n=2 Tax=Bifidobacterium adolescentis TaxID=1680 RepID=A0A1X2ZZ20_BIFAD|nr:transposase [Bifidobacterium adolescentis]
MSVDDFSTLCSRRRYRSITADSKTASFGFGTFSSSLPALAVRLELKVPKLKGTLFESAVIERGLKGVRLVVGDRCAGLVATVGSMLPKAKYQRCMVHFMRNVLSKTPPTHREWASAATWTCPSSMTTSWKRTDHRAMDGHDPKCATFRTLPALTSYHVDMSEDIKLNDLLHLTDEEISRTKIRFMTNYNGTEPIKVFRRKPDELNTDWLLSRKRNDNGKDAEHLHKGENVIGLVRLPENNDLWGLTCLKRIGDPSECPKEKSEDDDSHYVGYEGEELTEYRKFYGRVIVRYHKDTQQPIRYAEGLLDNLIVEKVLSSAESL